MKLIVCMLCFTILSFSSSAEVKPQIDIPYGKHERQKLDLWQVESSKPTPVLIYFHGGGFRKGDKSKIHGHYNIDDYLAKKIACISVNYPFLQHRNNNYGAIMKDCELALKFIKKNAKKWNIDAKRIAMTGSSAGALITQHLGLKTRDVHVMGVFQQPIGTDRMVLSMVKRSSPPLIIYQKAPKEDAIHHPKYAQMLKDRYDKKKAECVLYSSDENDLPPLPEGKDFKEAFMDFFVKHLK